MDRKHALYYAAMAKFEDIKTQSDMEKQGINQFDYAIIREILTELSYFPDYEIETEVSCIAIWFKNNGFTVSDPNTDAPYYTIRF